MEVSLATAAGPSPPVREAVPPVVGDQEVAVDQDQVRPRDHTTLAPATTCPRTRATRWTTTWTGAWTAGWTELEVHTPGPEVPREDFPPRGEQEAEEVQDIIPWIVIGTGMAVIETLCP